MTDSAVGNPVERRRIALPELGVGMAVGVVRGPSNLEPSMASAVTLRLLNLPLSWPYRAVARAAVARGMAKVTSQLA